MITTLLRAGARLDSIHRPRPDSLFNNPAQLYSALYVLEQGRVDVKHYPYIAQNEHYIKAKELIVGIQEDGSFKRFMRRPHRSVLRLRSLFARGRATPPCAIRCRRMRCYGAARGEERKSAAWRGAAAADKRPEAEYLAVRSPHESFKRTVLLYADNK